MVVEFNLMDSVLCVAILQLTSLMSLMCLTAVNWLYMKSPLI